MAIVCANVETVDGLEAYLRGMGITPRGARRLEDCAKVVTPSTVAVVLFPDDFSWEAVLATLAELAGRQSPLLRVLVTGQLAKYEPVAAAGDGVVVVPRPAWGFTILDIIRAHVDERGAAPAPGAGEP